MNNKPPAISAETRIVLLCIAAAVLFGLIMDQFTARICIEYFSIAHPPPVFTFVRRDSPVTVQALYWGVMATWWVGLMLGIPLALACRAGSWPKLKPGYVIRPLGILLLAMAGTTLAAGITGYILARNGAKPPGGWAAEIQEEAHVGFVSNVWSHLAAYGSGFAGGMVVIILALCRRRLAAAQVKAKKAGL